MNRVWLAIVIVVSIYCVVQAVRDVRRGERLMALFGASCAVALLCAPVPPGRARLVEVIPPGER